MVKQRIGLAGLGLMGSGMAAQLLKSGYEVTVYNRTRSKAEELAKMGAEVAGTPADVARDRDVVITMLADPPAVKDVVLGANGIIRTLKSGAVLVDCSTVDPATTAATLEAAAAKGAKFLDSPVAGSKEAAAQGELILMVGGDEAVLNEVREVLQVISKTIIHAGPSGSGTILKLCFNLAVSHAMAGLAEALVLGTKGGIDPQLIIQALMAGALANRFTAWKGKAILDRDFSTNFSVRLLCKDLNLMMSAGYDLQVPLPATAAVKELVTMAKAHGEADEDICAVVKVLEDLAGVEVK